MWDDKIRTKVFSEYKKKSKLRERIIADEDGYYLFMMVIKEFLTNKDIDPKRSETITRLTKKLNPSYETPKLRIVDRYFWVKTHP